MLGSSSNSCQKKEKSNQKWVNFGGVWVAAAASVARYGYHWNKK